MLPNDWRDWQIQILHQLGSVVINTRPCCYLDGKVLLKVLEFLTGELDRGDEEDVGLLDVVVVNVPSVGTHLCLEPIHGDMSVGMCRVGDSVVGVCVGGEGECCWEERKEEERRKKKKKR